MKKISEGYYYNVYDLGGGRVLKKQKTILRTFIHILIMSKLNIIHALKKTKSVLLSIENTRRIYEEILNTNINQNLIGNPKLLSGIDYEQDKIVIIRNILDKDSDFEKVVIDFSKLIKELWSFGIHERVFNFTINNGYNAKKEMLLIDFNEVTFNLEDALKDIREQVWLHKWSYFEISKGKKSIYSDIMSKEINEENLNKHWGTRRVKMVY